MATRTLRTTAEDEQAISRIREYLTETIGSPSESDILRFGLKAALRELRNSPKSRPRKQ